MTAPGFDPFTLGGDPYPQFARMRAAGGIARGTAPYPEITDAYYVFSHELVSRVLKHPAMLQAPPGQYELVRRKLVDQAPMALLSRSVLLADPPQHGGLRRPVAGFLSRASTETLSQALREMSSDLVEKAMVTGSVDAVVDLAVPVSFWLLQEILGLEIEDPWALKSMTRRMASAFDLRKANPAAGSAEAYVECQTFVEERIARNAFRMDGMVAAMAREVVEGRWLREDMVANVVFMLFAGQETVVDALGNAIVALDRFPDQRVLLDRRVVDWNTAAAELLRYGASVQYAVARIAAEDVELGKFKIDAGEAVVAVLGSANRDNAVFADGDHLDLTRAPVMSMTFGTGLHVCLGQHVARIEIAAMIEALFTLAPRWRLDAAGAKRRESLSFNGMSSVPLVLA
ncbi:MAG: cytochrome P450 [Alphaproteobacteria bacterium]|nr:cytochrome P450 [Alphaproteobacteria bacterium]MBU0805454.1 cytochrome P450 [Alphaproteobacteria bacterium]MBU0873400.1 cytochrome P450 [Alphaproteobacteria bacterium]MBU1401372.1 cytochrome P450 [Alphaproteobacteria bacterium]MBU1592211.1 cytochrome P450 [Alphaproteobacteria bacterium]